MKTITMKRYSEAFKQQVVRENESGQRTGLRQSKIVNVAERPLRER